MALPLQSSKNMRQNYSFLRELAVASYSTPQSATGDSTSNVISLQYFHELPNDSEPSCLLEEQNNKNYLYATLKASGKVMMQQNHTVINKVHQNPSVSLCPSVAFLPPSYHEAIFLNILAGEKHCPAR